MREARPDLLLLKAQFGTTNNRKKTDQQTLTERRKIRFARQIYLTAEIFPKAG
jgi:hypothetical protein